MRTFEDPSKRRARDLKRRYGITMDQYVTMWNCQNGKCDICGEPAANGTLVVDHDAPTGHVRSLLCHGCNTALGLMGHDASRLRAAAFYLQAWEDAYGGTPPI